MRIYSYGLFLFSLSLLTVLGGCDSSDSEVPTYQFVDAWGESGSEAGQFREPIGLAIGADSALFVSEAQNRRLQVFGQDGQVRRQIGPVLANGDSLRRPMHLSATETALYVPDFNTDRVHILSLEGKPQGTLDPSSSGAGFDAPGGVAVDGQERLYVTDFYHHRVLRLDANGAFDRQWGEIDSTGSAASRFTYPTDVTILPDGGFVVADAYNHRIKRYNPDGTVAWMRPEDRNWEGTEEGQFNVATAVAAGPAGKIYVADFYNHRIQVFSAEGRVLTAFGEQGEKAGQFERPVDVAVGPDGTLYVIDFGNHRIQAFTPES